MKASVEQMEMNKDLLEKAKNAKSAEELLALAHENGIADFTDESAEALFTKLHNSGELSDEELNDAVGGSLYVTGNKIYNKYCPQCKKIQKAEKTNMGYYCNECGALFSSNLV